MAGINKRARIWNYIKGKGSITQKEAWDMFRYSRLSGIMFVWKSWGVEIRPVRESNDTEYWTRYYIDREEIARAEKEGLVKYEAS